MKKTDLIRRIGPLTLIDYYRSSTAVSMYRFALFHAENQLCAGAKTDHTGRRKYSVKVRYFCPGFGGGATLKFQLKLNITARLVVIWQKDCHSYLFI